MQHETTERYKQKIVWDQVFSTYYWKITLKPFEKVKEITGYSKAQGHQEKGDKVALLIRIIIMLRKKGWMKKATEIKFYRRDGNFIGDNDVKILTMLPDTHQLDCPKLLGDKVFYDFMKHFYINTNEGTEIELLQPKERVKGVNKDKEYEIACAKTYKDLDELQVKYLYLKSIDIAPGMLNNFYMKVLERQPKLK